MCASQLLVMRHIPQTLELIYKTEEAPATAGASTRNLDGYSGYFTVLNVKLPIKKFLLGLQTCAV